MYPDMKKYFVVVPAYNEVKNIRRCVNHILKFSKNVIVVNDGSSDGTREILDSIPGIHTIHLDKNEGKGKAMRIGAEMSWQLGADGIIYMDGDNQHDPKHIPEFEKLLKENDIVVGVRVLKTSVPWWRKIGNMIMVKLMRYLFEISLIDMMCGYRAFTKQGYQSISWTSDSYGVEIEALTKIGRNKIPFITLVVDTIYHDKYKGFSLIDAIKILFQIPVWYLSK
jgi:glycosyltransferase involved in cell wall biosynthesis